MSHLKSVAEEASKSVEEVPVEGETTRRNLTIQGNEYVHGLQNTAYKLNKALQQNLKEHAKTLQEASQHFTNAAHDIVQSIYNFQPSDLKKKIRKSLEDASNYAHSLTEVSVTQEAGHHISNAINTLMKTVQRLEINAKFLGKTKNDIRNEINQVVARITAAVDKITNDDQKTVKDLREQLKTLDEVIGAMLTELEEFIENNPQENLKHLKLLNEVAENLEKIRSDVRSAVNTHEGLTEVKQKLLSNVIKVADETKKLVQVEEGEEGSEHARSLDKITKTVLIEGLVGAKNLATHLEVIAKQEE